MRRHSLTALLTGLALASFLLVGCGQSSGAQAAISSGEVTIKVNEWKYEPSAVRVEAGKPIKLVLRNDGKIEHNVKLAGLSSGGKEIQLDVKAGESASLQITPDKEGAYEMACTLPGHKDSGMVGKFEVVPGSR